ncbi:MAG: hypothetical protein ABI839_07500 [Verrucomicrobiota bacterium]
MKGHPVATPMIFPLVPFLRSSRDICARVVVLNGAKANNSFYRLVIGFTALASFRFGSYAGGAFNPAVAFGVTAMGLNSMSNSRIHHAAEFAAGAAAALAFCGVSQEGVRRSVGSPDDVPTSGNKEEAPGSVLLRKKFRSIFGG